MKNKISFMIPVLILLMSCDQKQTHVDTWNSQIFEYQESIEMQSESKKVEYEKQMVVADTITNWQFYKDSELLFKSNIFDSNRYTAKIKTSDNYENLILSMFYDFNNEIMKRKIELVFKDKVLTIFEDENPNHSAFKIPKSEIDKVINGNIGKKIYINYSNQINKSGLTIGMLEFITD